VRGSIIAMAAALALGACETPPSKQQVGTVLGGIIGGVIGAEISDHGTAGTILGAVAGAAVGASIGRTMDESDRRRVAQVLESTPSGRAGHWVNPDTGAQYRVTPRPAHERHGVPCREYTLDAYIGGRLEQVHGTACRQPDGSWRVAS
jgi:surface antigen